MNQYVLTLSIATSLLFSSFCYTLPATNDVGLTIVNNSGSTILITFIRSCGSNQRAKLLEDGEVIDFGKVYEASVQSYSTLWGCIAPAKHVLFPLSLAKTDAQHHDLVVRLKGIAGRSLFQPLGHWDYDVMIGKKAVESMPLDYQESFCTGVLNAFPTAKRKIMYTPRYILGLPQFAGLDDALEACCLLENKWHIQQAVAQESGKLVSDIIFILNECRTAFMNGQEDVPLHIPVEMRTMVPYLCPEEAASIAWS